MGENELGKWYGTPWKGGVALLQLKREIFEINTEIFMIYSEPSIVIDTGSLLGCRLRFQEVRLGVLS